MTPEEHQKRVEAAARALRPIYEFDYNRDEKYAERMREAERMLDAADKAVPVESKKELDWRLLTKDAEIGQLRHTCKRLDEVLYGATQALQECGLEFDEGLVRPIKQLRDMAERAEAALADVSKEATEKDACGRIMVGSGTGTYDPVCELPAGHTGSCKSTAAIDQHRLSSTREGR